MKFLPLRDFDDVTSALNFNTPDCRIVGGCDLYTTKAAGSDKKLYKNIESSLESQYETLLKLSASVTPPKDGEPPINLSRSSPFGPLSQVSSRRTFAYLIATLNASHSDYDFSHILRPTDFRKERSLKVVINNIDSTLYNLRPHANNTLQLPTGSGPTGGQVWGPQMWALIDNEMTLGECTIYCWSPPDEPFDEEEGAIWSLNYFFFNKERKRVAYIYIRGVPILGHGPRVRGLAKRSASGNRFGASKRARYWLGEQAGNIEDSESMYDDGVDDFDRMCDSDDFYDDYEDEADDESEGQVPDRGVSEDIASSMEF